MPYVRSAEGKVFCQKTKADHHRYLAEISPRPEAYREKALSQYQQAAAMGTTS